VGINRHTVEIRDAFLRNSQERGWLKVRSVLYEADAGRYIDIFMRPAGQLRLKYLEHGDGWMDLETPVALWSPGGQAVPDGYQLVMSITLPKVDDPRFQPPWRLTLLDADGRPVQSVDLQSPGEHLVRIPFHRANPGTYRITFDKSFSPPGDPRHLTARVNSWAFRFLPDSR
jgi:hypothetical protein